MTVRQIPCAPLLSYLAQLKNPPKCLFGFGGSLNTAIIVYTREKSTLTKTDFVPEKNPKIFEWILKKTFWMLDKVSLRKMDASKIQNKACFKKTFYRQN